MARPEQVLQSAPRGTSTQFGTVLATPEPDSVAEARQTVHQILTLSPSPDPDPDPNPDPTPTLTLTLTPTLTPMPTLNPTSN